MNYCKDCKWFREGGRSCSGFLNGRFFNTSINICDDFKPKEKQMKDTITLRGLIEQDACKDGVLWFWDNFENIETVKSEIRQGKCERSNIAFKSIKSTIEQIKETGKPEYTQWLKDHGYAVDDKQDKINELLEQLKDIQKQIEELQK